MYQYFCVLRRCIFFIGFCKNWHLKVTIHMHESMLYCTWRIIPGRKWLAPPPISKAFGFGRGPTTLLGGHTNPWLLTAEPSPGMILQELPALPKHQEIQALQGSTSGKVKGMLEVLSLGSAWSGITLDPQLFIPETYIRGKNIQVPMKGTRRLATLITQKPTEEVKSLMFLIWWDFSRCREGVMKNCSAKSCFFVV